MLDKLCSKPNSRRWSNLPKWEDLPLFLQIVEVKPYYDVLKKHRIQMKLKRVFDVLFALILLIILAIPMMIIAILIKIDSDGPVFYRQVRVTTYGNTFRIHKFRTMINNADKVGSSVTTDQDNRITKIGSKIRNARLDELPQLFDVLEGTMSFVGTRPEVVKYVEAYTEEMLATLLLPAGITSEASIKFKDEAKILNSESDNDFIYIKKILPQKMMWNLKEIKEFSLKKEIALMWETIVAVNSK